jgi:hypothetical protein
MSKRDYFIIIPAAIRKDTRLAALDMLIYGEIKALSNGKGYCDATNDYFCKIYNISERTVQRAIRLLVNTGHLKTNYFRDKRQLRHTE